MDRSTLVYKLIGHRLFLVWRRKNLWPWAWRGEASRQHPKSARPPWLQSKCSRAQANVPRPQTMVPPSFRPSSSIIRIVNKSNSPGHRPTACQILHHLPVINWLIDVRFSRPHGPRSPKSPLRRRLVAHVASIARTRAPFLSIFASPKRRRKILFFWHRPKSSKTEDKATQDRSRIDFYRFLMTFGSHFGIDFHEISIPADFS